MPATYELIDMHYSIFQHAHYYSMPDFCAKYIKVSFTKIARIAMSRQQGFRQQVFIS